MSEAPNLVKGNECARQNVYSLHVRLSCGSGNIPWDSHHDNRDVNPMHCNTDHVSSRFACGCCEHAQSSEGLDEAEVDSLCKP